MMHNLIPVLIFKYMYDVKTNFYPEDAEAAKYNYWYDILKIVMCKTDKNMADAEESDSIVLNVSLEFSKNIMKNLLPLQKQINPAPLHTQTLLWIQPPHLKALQSRAPPMGSTPNKKMTTQFLQ